MANQYVGVGVLFGFPGQTLVSSLQGLGVLAQVQNMDFSRKAQKDQVKDGTSNTSAVCYSDHEDGAVIDFVITSGTNAGALTIATMPTIGNTLAITDANFTPVTSTMLVDDISVSRPNNRAAMCKITLSRYLNNGVP